MKFSFINKILKGIKITRIIRLFGIDQDIFTAFVIYNISRFFRGKVDEKLIILGSKGNSFRGNSKYLYYYLREHTDYKLVWISSSDKLKKDLEAKGLKTIKKFSLEAIKTLRKAKFVFVTHGLINVLPIKFSKGTIFIQTWHGTPIKRINIKMEEKFLYYTKWILKLGIRLRNHEVYDYFVTPSADEKARKILASAMKIPLERVITTGYPRNDILFSKDPDFIKKIRIYYDIPDNIQRIFLYAPTWRKQRVADFPLSDKELQKLNQIMIDTNSIFLMKAHINEKLIKFIGKENIKIIRKELDIQELLLLADVVISDYSSLICDYSLLNRPFLLFIYDHNEYLTEDRGVYYDLERLACGPLLYTGKELIDAIENIEKIDRESAIKRLQIRDEFNRYIDGKSTERLLKFLKII